MPAKYIKNVSKKLMKNSLVLMVCLGLVKRKMGKGGNKSAISTKRYFCVVLGKGVSAKLVEIFMEKGGGERLQLGDV